MRARMARRRRPRGACWLSAASWENATYALGIKCLLSQIARGGIASRRGAGREESDVGDERSSMRLRIVRRRERKTGHQWARRCWLWWRWLKALRMGRRGVKGAAVSGGDDDAMVVVD